MDSVDLNPIVCIEGTPAERREKIKTLESTIKKMDQIAIEERHAFLDGAYFRQITIPADTVLTGKIHSGQTVNMVTRGKIAIATEDGEQIIEAPALFITEAGTKKAGYTLEETVFINGHITNETDLEKIEADVITDDYPELESSGDKRLCHG